MAQKTILAMRISEALKNKGMTQQKLSDITGISAQLISNYANAKEGEKGKGTNPTMATVVEIAKALDVSLDWLCGLTDKNCPPSSEIVQEHTTEEIARILAELIDTTGVWHRFIVERLEENYDFDEIREYDHESPAIIFRGGIYRRYVSDLLKLHEIKNTRVIDKKTYQSIVDIKIKELIEECASKSRPWDDLDLENLPF